VNAENNSGVVGTRYEKFFVTLWRFLGKFCLVATLLVAIA
jgi:hypothetical protein